MSVKLFDAGFYAGGNPDLIAAGLTTEKQLFNHFQEFGLNEGRGFSPLVDLKFYQSNNPDLANFNNQQLWEHLQLNGFFENRNCSPAFKFDPQLNCFVSVDANNSVIDWNNIVLNAIKTDRTPPPLAARNMAMVYTAIYDAVNAIAQTYTPYQITVPTPNFASPDAAAAAAAHRILVNLYPKDS
ncbi:hypothetical protein [Floridanema evergladense]|uniref:Uncharacterized protein n=1 Tax=Floridaenema evergladense BLCC-F167 TaxID=3153639 RepID=A0ABV4WW09_9CYAN